MRIADLHIHSRFSRATSRDCDAPHLDLWARRKGISIVGTGDFTHPQWREELRAMLETAEEGLYRLKPEYALPCFVPGAEEPRFVVTGEISTIYKRGGRTRKVHHVFLLPGLEEAEEAAHRLEAVGNLHSDGRPILGLDSRDLLETVLEACPDAVYIPAHIWTPHFSLFGAFSGFDTMEECFGDLTPYVHALETGLSSDPPMNRRLSALDGHLLVSNSDAHSPAKLGREANLLSCDMSYPALKRALETGDGFEGTIEFFPEEGKYHLDGHRACRCRLEPAETERCGGRCPVCGKKITIGVLNRVEQLADRNEPGPLEKPFESLVPLPEVIGEALGVSGDSKKAQELYFTLLKKVGSEFSILRERSIEDVEAAGGFLLGEGLRRLRAGRVIRQGGYDGEYGVIRLFEPGERETLLGQTTWLSALPRAEKIKETARREAPLPQAAQESGSSLNERQLEAVRAEAPLVAVIAGPGTGKTGTLVNRIAYLIEEKGVSPREITAVTFTRQAAKEMLERLEKRLGKKAVRGLTVGTFHSVCLGLIEPRPLVSREAAREILKELLAERGETLPTARAAGMISAEKNGRMVSELPAGLREQYQQRLQEAGLRDLDDVLLEALNVSAEGKKMFHYLLVDEFQDINAVQRELVRHWSRNNRLFVIGDPDQSIYGFRGADAQCFDRLLQDREDACLIRLTENYRSAPAVIETALAVIDHNPGEKRTLSPVCPPGPPVRLCRFPDDLSEGIWISREIARMTGGVDMLEARAEERPMRAFSEIAVLCRTHRQLEGIERCLRHDSIPCQITGREDFWETDRVQALIGFFEALLEPGNTPALQRTLRGLWRCPPSLIQRAEAAMALPGGPENEGFFEALAPYEALSPFAEAVRCVLPGLRKEKPRKLLEALAKAANIGGREVERLLNAAVFHGDMPSFLDAVRLGEEGDIHRLSGGRPSGAVRLMTLHGAKGLEFPVVFLAGLEKGKPPQERADGPEATEEERRLLFVGITRAKEELILTCGGEESPFLAELPGGVARSRPKAPARRTEGQQMSLFPLG